MNKSLYSLISVDSERGTYISYFLGAVVPLVALGFMISRYTASRIEPSAGDPGFAPLEPAHLIGVFICISSMSLACFMLLRQFTMRSSAEIRQLAQFDTLTGLPNRCTLKDRAEQALLHARRKGALFAICLIDLDQFKRVNDTLGHTVGDQLLCEVTRRLSGIVRFSDSVSRASADDRNLGVARLGGDEFTLLLTEISDAIGADRVARRVLEVLRAPFRVTDHELVVTGSLGIAIYPFDGDDVETLLKSADTAMYCAKEQGRNNHKFFSSTMNDEAARKLKLEERLRGAMSRNELTVHYQPVSDVETGKVVAAEALVRWDDADLGSVSPEEFIPIAEDTGLIDPIGEWVLRTACAQSRTWQDEGLVPIRMAVNVSGHQVRKPGFVEIVSRALQETGLSATQLELEITESTIMQDDKLIDDAFETLSDMGISLALDDFGTGYSSLTYLRRFSISRVKVDRSFVEGIPHNAENLAVSAAIISMAHNLMISVVAEGVETEEQAQSLRELECEELQGFLFSPPVCAQEFARFLDRENRE